jgi:hypothetical protein
MNHLIAYCGLDCGKCEAYLVTQGNDAAAQQRVLEQWRVQFNSPDLALADVLCDGCAAGGRHCGYCATCAVRASAEQRGVPNCAHCADYATCPTLNDFIANIPEARANLEEIRLLLAR